MDITPELRNGKYYTGKYTEPNEYRGWFCGTFMEEGHPGKTDKMEVKYAMHQKGEIEKSHYHKVMIEILIFLEGKAKVKINNDEFIVSGGDFFFADRNNIISVEYLEPSKIFALHSPSLTEEESDEVTL